MKKWVPALFSLLFLLSGCMTHKAVQTKQLTDFKKKVLSEHKQIHDMKIQMAPTQIEFNYYLTSKTNREADEDIFLSTRELVLSSEFRKTAIEESYFKHYSKDDRRYPDIIIRFFGTSKEKADYEYTASYYGPGVEGAKDRPIDAYKTWYFDDFKTKAVPVESGDQ
ncbi:hypothetical protein GE107_16365 [Cohnella sp. CFH 77786]|uniref:hypothetical protein n=1 Tax=Cohnella sp. CFH 77786 TaxID=2662265 RepID=UPI001C608F9C|nr:hypothetical protein [Cohnella sp. CFH 77786]MBW5447633.1 hypothetical protein [Cohnella sp. CFH 77786]